MPKGTETIIKMRLKPNTQTIDIDYILTSLLNLSAKQQKTNLIPAAKQIIQWAAQRGEKGLYSKQWKENTKKLEITQAQYFYILKILKNAGIIYKSKGRFYISKTFMEHIQGISKTIHNYLTDIGAL